MRQRKESAARIAIETGMDQMPTAARKIFHKPGAFAWQTLKAFKANQGLLLAGEGGLQAPEGCLKPGEQPVDGRR